MIIEKTSCLQVAEVNGEREYRKIGSGTLMVGCQHLGGMAGRMISTVR